MKMTNYPGKPLRKNSTEVAAINAIQAAVLMFVTFSFFISISSAQAKMSNQQCLNKIEELDEKYGFQEGEYTADDYKYEYAKLIQMIKLMEDGCANSVSVIKKFGKIDIAEGKVKLEMIRAKCEKVTSDPNCGYTQINDNLTETDSSSNQTSNDSPPPRKLTAAEQRRQEAQQKADDLGTQSQQLAQENQSKADAARQGKRKTHDQDYQASQCVKVDYNFGIFGALINTCNYKIHYTYCGYHPTENSWLTHMACENQKFGAGAIGPLKRSTAHTKNVEGIYWLACKDPAWPLDHVFVEGQGVKGRCREPGTNY